jgi:hypothetical protein
MAIGLSLPGGGVFTWLGDQVAALVNRDVQSKLEQSGAAWLAMSRAMAPVKTGALRAAENYRVEGNTLVLIMGMPYDIFQEFGTRNIRPRPHVRPALNAIGRIWGTSVEMEFNAPYIASPILAHKGDFVIPSGIQPRPLNARQKHHVQNVLRPSAKGLHKGNVKRAKFRVRRFG